MSNNDTELFELCKQVYKRTKWGQYGDEGLDYYADRNPSYPRYTSDYLLEKLPLEIPSAKYEGSVCNLSLRHSFKGVYHAWYMVIGEGTKPDYGVFSDTPLKALLKLTIALHDAGELKDES